MQICFGQVCESGNTVTNWWIHKSRIKLWILSWSSYSNPLMLVVWLHSSFVDGKEKNIFQDTTPNNHFNLLGDTSHSHLLISFRSIFLRPLHISTSHASFLRTPHASFLLHMPPFYSSFLLSIHHPFFLFFISPFHFFVFSFHWSFFLPFPHFSLQLHLM